MTGKVRDDQLERPYTLRSIGQMLGLSRAVITGLIEAGFVTPARGPRNEYRFSFQDVVLLRMAHGLRAARIPPRRIVRSLQRLRAALPRELPISGLRISAVGDDVAVRDGGRQWEVETGQLLMDFEVAPVPGSVAFLPHRPQDAADEGDPGGSSRAPSSGMSKSATVAPIRGRRRRDDERAADEWFQHAEELEESGAAAAAEAAYRRAVALAPDHADAWLNLGAMLCDAGRCDEAVALYDDAIRNCPRAALLHYNRAIALEDTGRAQDALAAYEASLRLAPDLADAHFNAARLHERLGNQQKALRHLSAYRRLQR